MLVAGAANSGSALWPAVLAAVALLSLPAVLGVRVAGRTVPPDQDVPTAPTTLAAT